jgi:hypothetical protein
MLEGVNFAERTTNIRIKNVLDRLNMISILE